MIALCLVSVGKGTLCPPLQSISELGLGGVQSFDSNIRGSGFCCCCYFLFLSYFRFSWVDVFFICCMPQDYFRNFKLKKNFFFINFFSGERVCSSSVMMKGNLSTTYFFILCIPIKFSKFYLFISWMPSCKRPCNSFLRGCNYKWNLNIEP